MSDPILLALIAVAGTTITALIGAYVAIRLRSLEVKVDGRLTELLAATKAEATATGTAAGIASERADPQSGAGK